MAEKKGFEPSVAFTTLRFQRSTLDHSDTSLLEAEVYQKNSKSKELFVFFYFDEFKKLFVSKLFNRQMK